ncbi:MAG: 4a-hydroxytetrahydrobiopterin dehydratase [Oligoflexia bacterium]|nr:4a-hydroxytetrahydrobiopterin dehydratase [Oligoflexia bacterium]
MSWKERDNFLEKEFSHKSYLEGLDFVNKVAHLSEAHNHHPDIEYTFRKVIIRMTTHDQGAIVTDEDWKLAKAIDFLLQKES